MWMTSKFQLLCSQPQWQNDFAPMLRPRQPGTHVLEQMLQGERAWNVLNSRHAGAMTDPAIGIDTAPINRPKRPDKKLTTIHFTASAMTGSTSAIASPAELIA